MTVGRVEVGLLNPKSPSNVGAVLRAVGCFEGDGVFYTGERFARAARFHTDTRRVGDAIAPQWVDCLAAARGDCSLVCVDWVEGATALPDFVHPPRAFYAFGPEDGTLDQALVDRADAVVYVPTTGCLNLAAAVNVVLYDREAKLRTRRYDDALVRRNRDTNNGTRVTTSAT